MGRMIVAVCLIGYGLAILVKNWGWLPVDFYTSYLKWAKEYWPVLLILLGVRVLVKNRFEVLEKVLGVLILLMVGLWFLCSFWRQSEWLNV
ncbi:MAG TPA: DUF5668 domain-containing protein [Bacillota bacterium]|nr:DUF5668 domain-containing protein [Bacillota bacterium]